MGAGTTRCCAGPVTAAVPSAPAPGWWDASVGLGMLTPGFEGANIGVWGMLAQGFGGC